LAAWVKLPRTTLQWAQPVLIDLYRSPGVDRAEGRPHKPPARLMCRLLRLLLVRFPGRTFVFSGVRATGRTMWPGAATSTAG
jgi:hypothetical protein